MARIEVGLPRESFAAIARHRGLLPSPTASSTSARGCGGCWRERAADGRAAPRQRRRRPSGSAKADETIRRARTATAASTSCATGPGPPRRRARGRRRRRRRGGRADARRRCTSARYLEALRGGRRGAGGDAGLRAARPRARHPGQRGARRRRPRGRPHGDHRRRAARSPAPATPTRSAARPATTPAPTSSAATATSTTPPPRSQTLRDGGLTPVGVLDLDLHYPNGTSALVERMERGDAALAARLAGHQRRRRHRAAAGRAANAPSPSPPRPTPAPTCAEVAASIDELAADAGGAGRLARLRHRRRRPARRLGILAARSSPRSAACSPPPELPVCVVQEGGYALPRAGRRAATPSPPACSGEDGGE